MRNVPRFRPWKPVGFREGPTVEEGILNEADVCALKAISKGEADAAQQIRALEAILHRIAGLHSQSFRGDGFGGQRDTDFAEGKRFVALQIANILKRDWQDLLKISPVEHPRG